MDVTPETVRAAQQGDPAAMEALIAGSYRAAYTLALRLLGNPDDAAEATQEAYIRMMRGLRRFREVGAFPTWLFKIVSNVCMTEIRKRNRRAVPIELEGSDDLDAPDPTDARPGNVEEAVVGKVFWEQLEAKVQALPESYRTVVLLRDVYGLSGEETGEVLGITPGAVKVRLHRARKQLRGQLTEQFPEWVTPDLPDGHGEKESA